METGFIKPKVCIETFGLDDFLKAQGMLEFLTLSTLVYRF